MDLHVTLTEVLEKAAFESRETGKGITFYRESGKKKLTYMEWMEESLRITGGLKKAGVMKDSFVILQLKEPELFLKGFWGALLCGAIPIPLTVSDERGLNIDKLINITDSIEQYIILTEKNYIEEMKTKFLKEDKIFNIELLYDEVQKKEYIAGEPDDIAYVQFSSGSTSNPKGACLTHKNISNNINGVIDRLGGMKCVKKDVLLNWLPLTHNAGLVASHLMPIYGGIDQHVMSPAYLIQNTMDAANLIKTKGATLMGCTNFFLKLLFSKLDDKAIQTLDFSTLRSIYIGGESINPVFVRQFTEKFSVCGVKESMIACCYGLAEATLLISLSHQGEGMKTIWYRDRELVLNGTPIKEVKVYTIDEKGKRQKDGKEGELVTESESVMRGYLGMERLDEWNQNRLHTGDIGVVTEQGIVVLGRKKDMIIINAKNFYIVDLELEIEKRTGILAETFVITSVHDAQSNENIQLYLLRELYEKNPDSYKAIEAVFETYTKSYLSDIFIVDNIPRTASGKKQRFQMPNIKQKQRIEEQKQLKQKKPVSIPEIKAAAVWEKVLNVKVTDIQTSFFKMGGNSLTVMECIAELKKEDIKITPEQFYSDPTIAGIVKQSEYSILSGEAEQGIVEGKPQLLPSRFLLLNSNHVNYWWNFNILVDAQPLLDTDTWTKIVRALVIQHDGLRHRFIVEDERITEVIAGIEESISIDSVCYEDEEELRYYMESFQNTLDITFCPFKVVLLQEKEENKGKVLFICHHALFDAYSAKLFLSDFLEIYDVIAVQKGEYISKRKTTSLKQWGHLVNEFANSKACEEDRSYWQDVCTDPMKLPIDFVKEKNHNCIIFEKFHSFSIKLPEKSFHQEELQFKLMAAWVKTISEWSGEEKVDIMYMLNGRYGIETNKTYDLSATIGWMAFDVPVSITIDKRHSMKEIMQNVKQKINQIPHGGISYGCLKDIKQDKKLNSFGIAPCSFNYYSFETTKELYQKEGHRLAVADETIQAVEHPMEEREHIIDLIVRNTKENELQFRMQYSCKLHHKKTILKLAERYQYYVEQCL